MTIKLNSREKSFVLLLSVIYISVICQNIQVSHFVKTSNTKIEYYTTDYWEKGYKIWEILEDSYGSGYRPYCLAIDSQDNVYIATSISHHLSTCYDVLIIKLSVTGEILWSRTWETQKKCYSYDISVDNSDFIYVTGYFDNDTVTQNDMFLLKYNSGGALVWEYTLNLKPGSENSNDLGFKLAIDTSNNVYVIGYSNNYYDSGDTAFLKKISTSGTELWNTTIDKDFYPMDIKIDIINKLSLYFFSTFFSNFFFFFL